MKLKRRESNAWFPPFRCRSAVAVSPLPLRKFRKNSINLQSLFVSGNKNPYYLGLKESKIEKKENIHKNMQTQRNHNVSRET